MLQAALILFESNEEENDEDAAYYQAFWQYVVEVTLPKYVAFLNAVEDAMDAEGNIVIDAYLDADTGIAACYNAMSEIELEILEKASVELVDYSVIELYREVANKYVATANALIAAYGAYVDADNALEQSVAAKNLVDTYNVWVKLTADTNIVAAEDGVLAEAIAAAQALIP